MTAPTVSRPSAPDPAPPPLSPRELGRWAWRQLTSMRTALLLLLLLALAAVPGSVVPQSAISASAVARWRADHPTLAPVYDALGLFSVYDSVWFSAIYLLLMTSLVGCIVPRLARHARTLRAAPPRAPRHLHRLPAHAAHDLTGTSGPGDEVRERVLARLRRRRYRVVVSEEGDDGWSVAAERGHLREAGNLLFHLSVVVVLVAFAVGQLFGYRGGAIVLVGQGFSNTTPQYDEFAPGSLLDPETLAPLSFTVDDFDVDFLAEGPQAGQPLSFGADLTYTEDLTSPERTHRLAVNEPLVLDGVSVFLVGHGYAPVVTVRDGTGQVAYQGPVVFLPQDASFASFGVLKVPAAQPEQLGFDGLFLPTYGFTMDRGPFSTFPDARDPVLTLLAYHGDLGMDDGEPQSVYALETDRMEKFTKADGADFRLDLRPGQQVRLPDGLGSLRFDGWQRWVKVQVSHNPAKGVALGGVVLGLVGLVASLYVRRRRLWVRWTPGPGEGDSGGRGGARLEVAGLDRSATAVGLADEVRSLADLLAGDLAGVADTGRRPQEDA